MGSEDQSGQVNPTQTDRPSEEDLPQTWDEVPPEDPVTLDEHKASPRLRLSDDDHRFIEEQINADGTRIGITYDRDGHARLRASQYVGTVRCPSGLRIEIHPKAAGQHLVPLLLYAYDLPPGLIDTETPVREGHHFLDALAAIYLAELRRVLRRGISRDYVDVQRTERYLQGTWNLTRQLRMKPLPSTTFECDHQELTADTLLNRTILYATHILSRLSSSRDLQRDFRGMVERLRRRVELVPVEPSDLVEIQLDRLTEHLTQILELSALLIRGIFTENLRAGERSSFALLIDMNEVWEKALERAAREAVADLDGWQVIGQARTTNLVRGRPKVTMRPDLVFKKDGEAVFVADAKWKTSVPNDDVYQVVAYQLAHGCDGALLYPDLSSGRGGEYEVVSAGKLVGVDLDIASTGVEDLPRNLRKLLATSY